MATGKPLLQFLMDMKAEREAEGREQDVTVLGFLITHIEQQDHIDRLRKRVNELEIALASATGAVERWRQDHALAITSLRQIYPLAAAYLREAPSDPDNAKLESARALL